MELGDTTMRDIGTKEISGYELIRERERLERRQPGLVSKYQSFLRDFAQFRELQRQFEHGPKKRTAAQSTFAARLK